MSEDWLTAVKRQRSLAVIRTHQFELGKQLAFAVAAGGMRLIEITWNSRQAANLIAQLRSELPDCLIGAGTLLNVAQLQAAIAAGAQFCFSPHVDPNLIQAATSEGVPIIPGAFSPTEILTAWQLGATSVKVFPIQSLGGPSYIRSLQGPLGHIPLIPTGGVTLTNARDFIDAGAIAVGLSTHLFPEAAIAANDWNYISKRTQNLIQQLFAGNNKHD
ncbi:MAG: bifunctional 4-hydroxy-2-oxoglutarate aldolase/2-dehydro-3-deoxy-phosphogluconate aldolase [Cyanothece sp. SIO1E1]|nr:bifunctional 4-hydroxy-2-oxoglutarate aldolase/2-dehydro-3-deoxy-phosphogluconate aldolase [Cyanothece sp. SIO1E1]